MLSQTDKPAMETGFYEHRYYAYVLAHADYNGKCVYMGWQEDTNNPEKFSFLFCCADVRDETGRALYPIYSRNCYVTADYEYNPADWTLEEWEPYWWYW